MEKRNRGAEQVLVAVLAGVVALAGFLSTATVASPGAGALNALWELRAQARAQGQLQNGAARTAERPVPNTALKKRAQSSGPRRMSGGDLEVDNLYVTSPSEMAQALVGAGVSISNVSYTGSPLAAGRFRGGRAIGFEEGIVLSSGIARNIVGPNEYEDLSYSHDRGGDGDLGALVSGITYDAAALEFSFVPAFDRVTFEFVFGSEEYNEFVNSSFNDVFAFFVNGSNLALVPGTGEAINVNNLNGGNPFGANSRAGEYFRNNSRSDPGPASIHTEMDGLTRVLTVTATVVPNQTNRIKVAIADVGDHRYDANVLIRAGSFSSSSPGSLSGRVTLRDGSAPVPYAQIQARPFSTTGLQSRSVEADANGFYQFAELPPGKYSVSAGAQNYKASAHLTAAVPTNGSAALDISLDLIRSAPRRKVIMIRGTGNNSTYDYNFELELIKAKYVKDRDYIIVDLWKHDNTAGPRPTYSPRDFPQFNLDIKDGANTIEESVKYIRGQIKSKWSERPIVCDIIGHSAGGLAARRLINEEQGKGLLAVQNCITLGTPYGGINGANNDIVAMFGVKGPLTYNYAAREPQGDAYYKPWSSITRPGSNGRMVNDYQTDFSEYNGVMYWGIGGKSIENTADSHWQYGNNGDVPRQYQLGTQTEKVMLDGLVNTYSAIGQAPRENIYADCQPRFRFVGVNHGTLPSNVIPDSRGQTSVGLMMQVLQDQVNPDLGWDGCGIGATNAHKVMNVSSGAPQLMEQIDFSTSVQSPEYTYFDVDGGQVLAVSILAEGGLTLRVTKPNGDVLNLTGGDASVQYQAIADGGVSAHLLRVAAPAAGLWEVRATPAGGAGPLVASLSATIENALAFEAAAASSEYANGARPIITAALAQGTQPLGDAYVRAYGRTPSGATWAQTLYDDGAHFDQAAGDGIYGAQMSAQTEGGVHEAAVYAFGSNALLEPFQRLATLSFSIAPNTAYLTRSYSDSGVDEDGDTVLEALQVEAGVYVARAGDYLVEAELRDGQGALIATALARGADLAPGSHSLALRFGGTAILKHNRSGPFRLANVKLFAEPEGRPVWIETDAGPRVTNSYTLAQFDRPPSVFVLRPGGGAPLAHESFDIVLQAFDEDTPALASVFYNTSRSNTGGTLIASGLAVGEHTVRLDTSALPNGEYWIYAVASDGLRASVTAFAPSPLRVAHPEPAPTATPIPTLALAVPSTCSEADALRGRTVRARITRSSAGPALTVALSSSDITEVRVPPVVTIASGALFADFNIAPQNDLFADGPQSVKITASALGLAPVTSTVTVLDDERPMLSVSIAPGRLSERGLTRATLTVSRNVEITPRTAARRVALSASLARQLQLPTFVTIPARAASVSVPIVGVDDKIAQGPRQVLVSATATGFVTGSAPLIITDDEVTSNGVISGRVLIAPKLLLGARGVSVTLRRGAAVLDVVTSDAIGNFRFVGLPPGNYTIAVAGVGWEFVPASKPVLLSVPSLGAPAASVSFAGTPRAAITSFSPGLSAIGGTVSIFGLNFERASSVKFGATVARFTLVSPTLIRAVVPPNAASGRITVVTPQGTAVSSADFFVAPPF